MKKLLSLTLAVLMLMTLMSCTPKKKTAYEILSEAAEKMEKLDSFDMSTDINIAMTTQGFTFEIPASIEIKASGIQSDAPEAYVYIDLSYVGMTISFEVYVADGYLYYAAMGTSGKVNLGDISDENSNESTFDLDSYMEEYDNMLKVSLEESVVQENEDGSKTVTYTIKKDQAISLIDKLITEMTGEEAAEEVRETLNQISDIKISQTVNKDGYISAGDMEYAFAVEGVSGADSVDLNLEFDMSLTLNNPGEPVEVTPMDGYESFEEVSPNEDMLEDFVPVM